MGQNRPVTNRARRVDRRLEADLRKVIVPTATI
jgi:hypothetical protein